MALANSQVQKHFQLHKVYKRSREILDLAKMNEIQHLQQINRRKPTKSIQTLDTRVGSSFQNSIELQSNKLDQAIYSFKKRYQEEDMETSIPDDDTEYPNIGKRKRNKFKGVYDWDKMSPRKQFFNTKSPYKNQDQFNNYKRKNVSPQRNKSLDFNLITPRDRKKNADLTTLSMQTSQQLVNPQHNIKVYQKNRFNQSIYRCLIDYNRTDSRKNISKKKASPLQPLPIPTQRLEKAYKNTQVNHSPNLHEFYHTISKDAPGQYHMKNSKNNQFYFTDKVMRDAQQDFASIKRKQDMITKRLQKIKKDREFDLNRNQICEKKYFFIKGSREKKQM